MARRAPMKRPDWLTPERFRVMRTLLVGLAVSASVTALSSVGVLAGWETRAVDAFLFFRDRVRSPEIVLVIIDDRSFRELGEVQPLPRRYLADLGDLLIRSGARVVGFDVLLPGRTSEEDDTALTAMTARAATGGATRLVFSARARPQGSGDSPRYEVSRPFSPEVRGELAFANAPLAADGLILRMAPVLPATDGGLAPSFALALLAAYTEEPRKVFDTLTTGGPSIRLPVMATDGHIAGEEEMRTDRLSPRTWRIDFAGPAGSFTAFPSGPLVQVARSGAILDVENPFRGRIVLIGAAFDESRELYPTPVGPMTGVEIQANMVHTLLSRRALLPPHWALNLSLLTGTCLAVAALSLWLRPAWVVVASLDIVAGLVTFSYEAYLRGGYWLDLVAPVVGMLAYVQGARWLERRRLRSAFGQFVSREVMARVMREGAELGGEVRTVSVLMSDLRGFTPLSERLSPAEVSKVMNEYFTVMVDVILHHRGTVQDFVGDAILAVFGAPLDDPQHPWHAVATATGMQSALERVNTQLEARGLPTLAMGIAVNTGSVFAGNVGAPQRKKYAVLGDTVNTVSRMEGLNRELGTRILISETTLTAVKALVVTKDRGSVPVRGRRQPVQLHELLEVREPPRGTRAESGAAGERS